MSLRANSFVSTSTARPRYATCRPTSISRNAVVSCKAYGKLDIIEAVSHKTGLSNKEATAAVNATLDTIQEAVTAGNRVTIVGFGAFLYRERAARKGRNPRTQEEMDFPASKHPAFIAAKNFKDRVKAGPGAAPPADAPDEPKAPAAPKAPKAAKAKVAK